MLPMDEEEDADELGLDRELIGDIDDADEMAEDEDGIDLFADNFERDYQRREDDAYAGQDIDDEGEYEQLDPAERRRLEARMFKRDRDANRRMPAAFLDDEDEDAADLTRQPRRRRHHYDEIRKMRIWLTISWRRNCRLRASKM